MERKLPPNGWGAVVPGRLASLGRMRKSIRSASSSTLRVSLDRVT